MTSVLIFFHKKQRKIWKCIKWFTKPLCPREGVIIECPLNDLFHNAVTVILMSRMDVSEMVVNVGNVVTVFYFVLINIPLKGHFLMVKWLKNNDNHDK